MVNRHRLVAGATGTGKTKTLHVMAEQLCAAGVPVLLADVKGDVSGMGAPGAPNDRITARAAEIGQTWQPTGYPVELFALGGHGKGVPVRATIISFGARLLSKVRDLNDMQESSLCPSPSSRPTTSPHHAGRPWRGQHSRATETPGEAGTLRHLPDVVPRRPFRRTAGGR